MSDLFTRSASLSRVVRRLRNTFELWGYEEVFLPTVETYRSELRDGMKFAYNDEFCIVRPDITSQIAVNLKGRQEKLRLFYVSEVIKKGVAGTWQAGTWQAGIEFIGGDKKWSNVEILNIAISAMNNLGITDFYIDVGSVEIWKNIAGKVPGYTDVILDAVSRRNFAAIDKLPIEDSMKKRIWEMMNSRGKSSGFSQVDDVVSEVNHERIIVDLGTVELHSYYDSLVFEIYSPRFEYLIGNGGSYRIGDIDAVGFAFNLDSLASLYDARKTPARVPVSGETPSEACSRAQELVKMGIPVEVVMNENSPA